jgi:hypothetical protein
MKTTRMFLPDPTKKLYFWSYSKGKAARGCPRKFLMTLLNVPSTDPIQANTLIGSFLHKFLELYLGGRQDFSIAVNNAVRDVMIVDKLGFYNKTAPGLRQLVGLATRAADIAKEFTLKMTERYPDIKWLHEEDLRIKEDFTEVEHPYNQTMVRSKKTWFTGAIDLLGYSKDDKTLLICDYKYYDEEVADLHKDQLNCYNALVPAVLESRKLLEVEKITNAVIFLKQKTFYEFPHPYVHSRDKDSARKWLKDFVADSKAMAEKADIESPVMSADNCKYCNYKRKCKPYVEALKANVNG